MNYLEKQIGFADSMASYNWAFDNQAMKKTNLEYSMRIAIMDLLPNFCLMDCYANSMINATYFKMVDDLEPIYKTAFLSHSGKNYGYSAQCMARWVFEIPTIPNSIQR